MCIGGQCCCLQSRGCRNFDGGSRTIPICNVQCSAVLMHCALLPGALTCSPHTLCRLLLPHQAEALTCVRELSAPAFMHQLVEIGLTSMMNSMKDKVRGRAGRGWRVCRRPVQGVVQQAIPCTPHVMPRPAPLPLACDDAGEAAIVRAHEAPSRPPSRLSYHPTHLSRRM